MTGTGSSSSPFIIKTVEDLYLIKEEGSQAKYFELGADIDLTGTSYATNFQPLSIKFKRLDGKGHTIRGIYKNAVGSSFSIFEDDTTNLTYSQVTIRNLTVEAEIVADTVRIFNYNRSESVYNISNCCFILKCTGSVPETGALMHPAELTLNFSYCTIILNADLTEARPFMQNGSIMSSQVRSDAIIRMSDSTVTDNAMWQNVNIGDTGFFGSIELIDGGDAPGSIIWAYGGSHGNIYQVIEYENIAEALWNSTISTVCFYDKDKVGNAEIRNTISEEQNLLIHGLTTAQCTDAAYLRSIGYVCEGEE